MSSTESHRDSERTDQHSIFSSQFQIINHLPPDILSLRLPRHTKIHEAKLLIPPSLGVRIPWDQPSCIFLLFTSHPRITCLHVFACWHHALEFKGQFPRCPAAEVKHDAVVTLGDEGGNQRRGFPSSHNLRHNRDTLFQSVPETLLKLYKLFCFGCSFEGEGGHVLIPGSSPSWLIS